MIFSNIRALPIFSPIMPPFQQSFYMTNIDSTIQITPDYCNWLVTPVDISNPEEGFVLSSYGYFLSSKTVSLNDYERLTSTSEMNEAAHIMPVEVNGHFYLQLVGTSSVLTMNLQGMVMYFDELIPNNSYPVYQYFIINDQVEYDNDSDQYFWICNNRTGGVLSLNGNFCCDELLTIQQCEARYDQLWKIKDNAIISRANGFVLEARKDDNAVISEPHVYPPAENQLWNVSIDGTITNLLGTVELYANGDTIGCSVEITGLSLPSEWHFVPCVMAPDVTENQMEGIDENNAFRLRNAAADRVLTVSPDIQAGTPVQLLTALQTKSSWMKMNTEYIGSYTCISAGSSNNVWVIAESGYAILKYTGDDSWTRLDNDMYLQNISVGSDGSVWGVSTSAEIYRLDGDNWTCIQGWFRQVSVGNSKNIWGISPNSEVFKYTGDDTNPWEKFDGQFDSISVGVDDTVWGVTPEGAVYRLDNMQWNLISSNFSMASIIVGSKSNVWLVDSYTNIYQYTGDDNLPWAQIPGCMYFLSVAADGSVWGISKDDNVYRNVAGPAADNQLWCYKNGRIKTVLGDFVIEASSNGLILSTDDGIESPTQDWLITDEGYFLLDQPDAQLVIPSITGNQLTYNYYSPLRPVNQVWYVEDSQSSDYCEKDNVASYNGVNDVIVSSLKVIATLSNDWCAGTTDLIAIKMNNYGTPQQLFNNPSYGASVTIEIDLFKMFDSTSIMLSSIQSVSLYQIPSPHPFASDDWKLKSLVLIVNDHYYNYSFGNINKWLKNHYNSPESVWSAYIKPDSWSDNTKDIHSSWMTSSYDIIGNKFLSQLALPGSHDAGMYTGEPFYFLGKTQDLSIYDQLNEGIRYFDLRPAWVRDAEEGENYFAIMHGPIQGAMLMGILDDVANFMSKPGRREMVILKISHYNNFNDKIYCNMVNMIKSKLDNWLCTKVSGLRLADTPMSSFIASKGAVLVVCDENYPVKNKYEGIYTYRDWNSRDPENGDLTVYDAYSNTTDLNKMKSDQANKFATFNGRCLNNQVIKCDLFLLSWTLTPVTAVWYYAKDANKCICSSVTSMTNPNVYGKRINIAYVDYVEYPENSNVKDLCLKLNGIR